MTGSALAEPTAALISAEEPAESAEGRKTAYVGMVVLIAAWAMMFIPLFFIYGAMRVTSDGWPPLGLPMLPLGLSGLNTGVIAASSLVLEYGLWRSAPKKLAWSLVVALVLGLVFLAIQYGLARGLAAEGLRIDAGAYAAVFYGFAGIHAGHVVIGLVALGVLAWRVARTERAQSSLLSVRLWAVYWHFVGVIWLLMFLFVFVL